MASKKTIDAPFYALVGAADYVVSNVRDTARATADSAVELREEFTPQQVQGRVSTVIGEVREQVASLPSVATERYESVVGGFERTYGELAKGWDDLVLRGEQVAQELRNQPTAKKFEAQVDEVTDRGRAAVASARKGAVDAQSAAVSAVYSARKDAAKGARDLAGSVGEAAAEIESDAETAVRSNAAKEGYAKRPARRTVAKNASAKKAPAKKAPAKKAPAKRTAKKAPAKKA